MNRVQFDQACKDFIQRRPRSGWGWKEHSVHSRALGINHHVDLPGFGYLERTTFLRKQQQQQDTSTDCNVESPVLEPDDDASALLGSVDRLTCHQYVVLSATFQVPTFYFSVYDSSGGSPVLSDVMQTSLFRRDALEGADVTAYSIGHSSSNFPVLSFGDHPALSIPCWYLHPCQTGPAVEEILEAAGQAPADGVRWLEAWFMVLGSVVDLSG